MPSRTAAEFADDYAHAVRRVLACVTNAFILNATAQDSPTWPRKLWIPNGPVRLRMRDAGARRITLDFSHGYQVVPRAESSGWQSLTTAYYYTFLLDDGRELLAFHWHDEPRMHERSPHLHLEAGCEIGFVHSTRHIYPRA